MHRLASFLSRRIGNDKQRADVEVGFQPRRTRKVAVGFFDGQRKHAKTSLGVQPTRLLEHGVVFGVFHAVQTALSDNVVLRAVLYHHRHHLAIAVERDFVHASVHLGAVGMSCNGNFRRVAEQIALAVGGNVATSGKPIHKFGNLGKVIRTDKAFAVKHAEKGHFVLRESAGFVRTNDGGTA